MTSVGQVSHLEASTAAMCDDLLNKTSIIEQYVRQSRTGRQQHDVTRSANFVFFTTVLFFAMQLNRYMLRKLVFLFD